VRVCGPAATPSALLMGGHASLRGYRPNIFWIADATCGLPLRLHCLVDAAMAKAKKLALL
jgi:hypothetical protein